MNFSGSKITGSIIMSGNDNVVQIDDVLLEVRDGDLFVNNEMVDRSLLKGSFEHGLEISQSTKHGFKRKFVINNNVLIFKFGKLYKVNGQKVKQDITLLFE